jgi:uncharacterized protein (DUF1499 family)
MRDLWTERLAKWGLRLAIAAPLMAVLFILVYRFGLTSHRLPFFGMALGVMGSGIALLLSAGALIGGLGGNGKHMQKALMGLVLALLVLYLPLNFARRGAQVPAIHDISTDLQNPPVFVAVPAMRAPSDNSLAIDPDVQAAQSAYYTDVAPLFMTGSLQDSFAQALSAAKGMGWQIVASNADKGTIEATATTALFNFKDDVVIRLSRDGSKTRIDVRSASRVGQTDLGANAARINAYFAALK